MPGFIEAQSSDGRRSLPKSRPLDLASQGFHTFAQIQELAELDTARSADQPVICWGLERLRRSRTQQHRPRRILSSPASSDLGHLRTQGVATSTQRQSHSTAGRGRSLPRSPPQVWGAMRTERRTGARPVPSCSQHRRCSRQRSRTLPVRLAGTKHSLDRRDHEQRSLVRPGHAEGLRGIGVIAQLPDQGRGLSRNPIPTAQARWDQPSFPLTGVEGRVQDLV